MMETVERYFYYTANAKLQRIKPLNAADKMTIKTDRWKYL